MTTTRKTLEMDKVTDEPAADPTVERLGRAMDEATPAGGRGTRRSCADVGKRRKERL